MTVHHFQALLGHLNSTCKWKIEGMVFRGFITSLKEWFSPARVCTGSIQCTKPIRAQKMFGQEIWFVFWVILHGARI